MTKPYDFNMMPQKGRFAPRPSEEYARRCYAGTEYAMCDVGPIPPKDTVWTDVLIMLGDPGSQCNSQGVAGLNGRLQPPAGRR